MFDNAGKHFTTQTKKSQRMQKRQCMQKKSQRMQKIATKTPQSGNNGNSFHDGSHVSLQLHYVYLHCKCGR